LLRVRFTAPVLSAGHPVSRITPCSALRTPARLRIAPHSIPLHCAALGLLRSRHLALCAAPGLLRGRRLARRAGLRIAPYADTLRPCAVPGFLRSRHLSPAPPQITLCPTLGALRRLRIAPLSLLAPCTDRGLLRVQHLELGIEPGLLRLRYLSLRPVRGLLRVRHLALCSTYGFLRTLHLVPGISRRLLRHLYLVLRAGTF